MLSCLIREQFAVAILIFLVKFKLKKWGFSIKIRQLSVAA
jgi:hypothetical protein